MSGNGAGGGLRALTILAIAGTLWACGVYGPPVRSLPEDAQTVEQRDREYEAEVIRDAPSTRGDPGLGLPPDLENPPETEGPPDGSDAATTDDSKNDSAEIESRE